MTNSASSYRKRTDRPNRLPDVSIPMEFPTEQTLNNIRHISENHEDSAVRTLAVVLLRLCPAVEGIARALPNIAAGEFTSLAQTLRIKR